MTLVYAYQNRGLTRDITILDADGDTITVGASDDIRAIIGRLGQAPKLTVTSTASANGSVFTPNSPSSGTNRLRIDASDLDFHPGTYTLTIDYQDNADAAEWKTVDRQVFTLEEDPASG